MLHSKWMGEPILLRLSSAPWPGPDPAHKRSTNPVPNGSGQAYALLALYKRIGERAWLHRAQELAEKAAIAYRELAPGLNSDAHLLRPDSLYKGELGVAVLAADLQNPNDSAMPAFELIDF
jgi:hypothetical protein